MPNAEFSFLSPESKHHLGIETGIESGECTGVINLVTSISPCVQSLTTTSQQGAYHVFTENGRPKNQLAVYLAAPTIATLTYQLVDFSVHAASYENTLQISNQPLPAST